LGQLTKKLKLILLNLQKHAPKVNETNFVNSVKASGKMENTWKFLGDGKLLVARWQV
jgi:hypothetical protein